MTGLGPSRDGAALRELLEAMRADPDVSYFPIRHHSPACSRHLERLVEELRPATVLIEGPESGNVWIEDLVDPDCVPPVALYFSFADRTLFERLGLPPELGVPADGPGAVPRASAWVPFAASSPEWVALRAASRTGARVRFIDLDWPETVLVRRVAPPGGDGDGRAESLAADPHLRHSALLAELGRRFRCRDPDELWDHLFEAVDLETADFVDRVVGYCAIARWAWDDARLEADGTVAREAAMAAAIREEKAREREGPVLVVTGGFHTVALPAAVAAATPRPPRPPIDPDDADVWLVPFTEDRLDALAGYASGMPNPGYYDRMWRARDREGGGDAGGGAMVAELLVEVARLSRERGLPSALSTADAIAAVGQARSLASLRGHRLPQREDVLDAVRSVYVKGEMDGEGEILLGLVREVLSGSAVGRVPATAARPPIVDDFRREAGRLRLPVDTIERRTVELDLYRRARHREASRFLHRLDVLGVPYGRYRQGPDFSRSASARRRIEIWETAWSPPADAALLEASDGAPTVAEAALGLLERDLRELAESGTRSSLAGADLLFRALRLGLHGLVPRVLGALRLLVDEDAELVSVAVCLDRLCLVERACEPLEAGRLPALADLVERCWRRACRLVDGAAEPPESAADAVVAALVSLREQLASADGSASGPARLDPDLLVEALERVLARPPDRTHGVVAGAAAGLLRGFGRLPEERLIGFVRGWVGGAHGTPRRAAAFVRGLLATARELAWRSEETLAALDRVLAGWTDDDFLRVLPELRLAFSDLTPRETLQVASRVAQLRGGDLGPLAFPDFTSSDVEAGLAIEREVRAILRGGTEGAA